MGKSCINCVYYDRDEVPRCELTGDEITEVCNQFSEINRRYRNANNQAGEHAGMVETADE